MIKQFCDVCKKELTRNMVTERLVVKQGGFVAEVMVSKDGVGTEGDICHDCLIKLLTIKPKRKYMRKSEQEPVPVYDQLVKRFGTENLLDPPATTSAVSSENLSIHVPSGIESDKEYIVRIGYVEPVSGSTLRGTALLALENFDGVIPDCLNEYERKTIEGILNNAEDANEPTG